MDIDIFQMAGTYFAYSKTPTLSYSFSYSWLHLPTGTKGKATIWVRNHSSGLVLLAHWNRAEDWKYSLA